MPNIEGAKKRVRSNKRKEVMKYGRDKNKSWSSGRIRIKDIQK